MNKNVIKMVEGGIMNIRSKKIHMYARLGILIAMFLFAQKIGQMNLQAMMLSKEEISYEQDNKDRNQLKNISSYDEFIEVLKDRSIIAKIKEEFNDEDDWILYKNAIAPVESAATGGENSYYSTTNLQVAGVDEADIMKNDGRYIYQVVKRRKITIVDTKDQLKVVSEITNSNGILYDKIFLDGDKLIVLSSCGPSYYNKFGVSPIRYSMLQVYDIKDRSRPKLIRQIGIEGDLNTARKIDDTVYMITHKWIETAYEGEFEKEDIIPKYIDGLNMNDTRQMDISNIWYEPWTKNRYMTFMTAVQINENKPIKVQAILGDFGNTVYMNPNALYLSTSVYNRGRYRTYIKKFDTDKQNITYVAAADVQGSLVNQFCMDEYKGNFRVAVTNQTNSTSAVYVFDSKLSPIGSLEGLAPEEKIYSVRFDGDKGYVVTFKQIDPLFVIDLKDPKAPKVSGELKVPGYSTYLHPIGKDFVVGIGRSTSEIIRRDEFGNEVVTGVTNEGIKLSLFDVKDSGNPKEINSIILGTAGSYSEAISNHKAVAVHTGKNLLAIPVSLKFEDRSLNDFEGAYVFGIENGKLVGKVKLGKIEKDEMHSEYVFGNDYSSRVCYIGDRLYMIYYTSGGSMLKINEYELDTFKRTQTITLN